MRLGRDHSDETKAKAGRLRAEGLTLAIISQRLGVSQSTLGKWLAEDEPEGEGT